MTRLLHINNHLKIITSSRYSFSLASHNNRHGLSDRMSCLLSLVSESRGISTSSQFLQNSLRLKENLCYVRPNSGRKGVKRTSQSTVYSDLINVLDTRKDDLSNQQIKRLLTRPERPSSLKQSPISSIDNKLENKSNLNVSQNIPVRKTNHTPLKYDFMNYGTVASNTRTSEIDPSTTRDWRTDVNFFNERFDSEIFKSEFLVFDNQMVENEMNNILYENPISSHSSETDPDFMLVRPKTDTESDVPCSIKVEKPTSKKTKKTKKTEEELQQEEEALEQNIRDFQMTVQSEEMVEITPEELYGLELDSGFPSLLEFDARFDNGVVFEPHEFLLEAENILLEFPIDLDVMYNNILENFKKSIHVGTVYNLEITKVGESSQYNSHFTDTLNSIQRLSGFKTRSSGKPASRRKKSVEPWMAFDQKQNSFDKERTQLADVACAAGMVKQMTEEVKNLRKNPMRLFSNSYKVTFPSTYNVLINQNAKIKELETVRELYDTMKEDKLEISYQTVAGYLECLGRLNYTAETYQHLRFILDEMESLNLDIDQLFQKCIFKKDEREYILKAIRQEKLYFKPSPLPPPLKYEGSLLEELNTPPEQVIDTNPLKGVMSTEDLKNNFKRQVDIELQHLIHVPSLSAEPDSPIQEKLRKKITEVESEWREAIQRSFRKKLSTNNILNFENRQSELYPFLTILPEEEYVDLILKEMTFLATSPEEYSPLLKYLCQDLGKQVYQKYYIEEKKYSGVLDKICRLYELYLEEYNNPIKKYPTQRESWHSIINQHPEGPTVDAPTDEWINHFQYKIGSYLYDIILYDLKIDNNLLLQSTRKRKMVPAVYVIFRSNEVTQFQEIKMNLVVSKLYQTPSNVIRINARELPVLTPPIPWLNSHHGGTVLSTVKLIRSGDPFKQQDKHVDQLPAGQMNPVLDSLNTLAACAWKINQPILDIATAIFNDKGNPKLEIPPPQSELPALQPLNRNYHEMTVQERGLHHFERRRIVRLRSDNWSLRSFELYRLSVANKYRDEIFWFPHNIDFRGRTYPSSPYLNHLGSDVARGLLMFAKGRPLGPDGLNWLKIHLINLTGLKKRSSNTDRLAYAETLLEEIQDSADNPMTGQLWWQSVEEPWQVLACCMEITKAMRSPDHTKFISHFPVHQDGSCNGLQHYAALGRDDTGAKSVNLCSFPEPQDVYSEVVELVEKLRQEDADKGIEIAKLLEGKVLRKTIKQTVMTTVYGVTKYGATQQISKQLNDITDFDPKTNVQASGYLADKTFSCLKEMFSSTRNIQEWLRGIADGIGRETNQAVEWVTPLGLPVIQPYRSKLVFHHHMSQSNVDVNKQKNGLPPNFIHSLDSTHMMLTSLYCQWVGINFISVHDCYWTHACHVPIMNKLTREQFVNLHKQPVLENLVQYISERLDVYQSNDRQLDPYRIKEIKKRMERIPNRGEFDIEKVLDSEYFFS